MHLRFYPVNKRKRARLGLRLRVRRGLRARLGVRVRKPTAGMEVPNLTLNLALNPLLNLTLSLTLALIP
jgi:hypothetical protein